MRAESATTTMTAPHSPYEAIPTKLSETMSWAVEWMPDWDRSSSEQSERDRTNHLLFGSYCNRSGVLERLQNGEASKVLLDLTISCMGMRRRPHKYCVRATLLVDALAYATDPSAKRLPEDVCVDLVHLGLAEIYCDLITDSAVCRPHKDGNMVRADMQLKHCHRVQYYMHRNSSSRSSAGCIMF